MRVALEDLKLERLTVLYPGDKSYPLHEKVIVVPLADLASGGGAMVTGRKSGPVAR